MPGAGAAAHHEKATYDRFGRPFQHFDASRTEARFDFNGTRRAYNANGHLERLQDAEGTLDGQGKFTPSTVYRTVTAMDARGNVTAETLGNGVRRSHAFDGQTGRLLGIESGRSSAKGLQDLAYDWDRLGSLKSRTSGEGESAVVETFGYDGLNRLTSRRVGAGPARSATYDGYGNVRSRTGTGTYAYGADSGASGRPHAVASVTGNGVTTTHAYDANGSLTSSSDGRTVAYAAFGKARSISRGARRDPGDWTELADAAARSFDACATTRGFTGHEMLDAVGAVHMNGRLHDPALGRFLRADPFVQFPADLQSHNRYSYALNNPLAHTDPSGHFILTFAATAFIATTTANIRLVTTLSTLAAAGFGDALLHGASFQQALLAGSARG